MRYVFFLNHSPEWKKIIDSELNALVSSKKNVEILWESSMAKALFSNDYLGIPSKCLLDGKFNRNSLPKMNGRPSIPYTVFCADIDRWEYWGTIGSDLEYLESYFWHCYDWLLEQYDGHGEITFVYEQPTTTICHVFSELAKLDNFSYRGYMLARIGGYCEIHKDGRPFYPGIDIEVDKKLIPQESENSVPDYMKSNVNKHVLNGYFNVERFNRLLMSLKFRQNSFQLADVSLSYLCFAKRKVAKVINAVRAKKLMKVTAPNKKYFVFPLHFRPEASTSYNAWWMPDQYELLRILRKSLPSDVLIVAKVHPVAVGQEFKSMSSIRKYWAGIEFLSYEYSNQYLIEDKNCLGILSINSTMIFDALKYRKPIGYFGNGPFPCNKPYLKKLVISESLPEDIMSLTQVSVPEDAYQIWSDSYKNICNIQKGSLNFD